MPDTGGECIRQIQLGEDSCLAFAEVVLAGSRIERPGRDALADELAAFANSSGGVLWLGVSDAPRAVTGIPLEHLDAVQRYVIEIADGAITPPVVPLIEKLELPDAGGRMRPVLRVEMPRGFFVHRSPGGYLQRVGTSKRVMETAVLARLFEQRSGTGGGQFDLQVVEDATLDDLDPRLVDRFSRGERRRRPDDRALEARHGWGGRRRRAPPDRGRPASRDAPAAALAAARVHPVGGVPWASAFSDAMGSPRYQLDAKDNDGPLDDQIEYACRFVARNQRVEASKHLGRIDWPQYDLAAVFEAVVNAVAHRDYSRRGSKVRLRMFSDRIELYSPGAPANGMRLEEIAYKQSARNPAIANLLERCAVRGRNRGAARHDDGPPRRGRAGHSREEPAPLGQTAGVRALRGGAASDNLRGRPRRGRLGVAEQADHPPWRHRGMSILDASLRKTWDSLRARKQVQNDFLDEVRLKGLRGIRSLRVAFDYPVSVIAGANGCGKSTVLFACAAAYAPAGRSARTYTPAALFPGFSDGGAGRVRG